jgi:hypothetical protein
MIFVSNLAYIGISILGGYLAVRGLIGVGDILAFIQYVRQFTQPIAQVANISNVLQSTMAAAERVFAFLDQEEETPEPEKPVKPDRDKILLMGAFLTHGVQPGPLLMKEHPEIFWGVITSMYTGNALLLLLNLPLIGIWVRLLKVPYGILFPLILLFCLIGVYSLNNNIWEILIMIIFGIVGLLFKKLDYPMAPMVLALVLGNMAESAVRQALIMGRGSPLIFFRPPIALPLMLLALFLFFSPNPFQDGKEVIS